MVSNSLRKMNEVHKDISISERKLNAALVVAQDKPASVVKNYNSGKYYLMKYTGCKDDRNGDTLGQRKKNCNFLASPRTICMFIRTKGFRAGLSGVDNGFVCTHRNLQDIVCITRNEDV